MEDDADPAAASGALTFPRRRPLRPMPLGAALSRAPSFFSVRPEAVTEVGREQVLLRPYDSLRGWRAVPQWERNTCVAFAATAALEMLVGPDAAGTWPHFSPQFVYWLMRRDPPSPPPPGWETGATYLRQAREVIVKHGCCEEHLLPYSGDPVEPLAGREPDAAAFEAAGKWRQFHGAGYWHRPSANDGASPAAAVFAELEQGRPVLIALEVFRVTSLGADVDDTHWTVGAAAPEGLVREIRGEDTSTRGGHAVCAIGFHPSPSAPGGGWFVFRNSFGRRYGQRPPAFAPYEAGVGLGMISVAHVDRACWEWLSLERRA